MGGGEEKRRSEVKKRGVFGDNYLHNSLTYIQIVLFYSAKQRLVPSIGVRFDVDVN